MTTATHTQYYFLLTIESTKSSTRRFTVVTETPRPTLTDFDDILRRIFESSFNIPYTELKYLTKVDDLYVCNHNNDLFIIRIDSPIHDILFTKSSF